MTNRLYTYSDALMLAASKVVVSNLRSQIRDLSDIRSAWNRSYATNLDERINAAISTIVYLNASDVQNYVNFDMYRSIQNTIKNLSLLRAQLEFDLRDDSETLERYLQLLGFSMYSKPLGSLTENELIEMLSEFVVNSIECLNREIHKLGVSHNLLEKITNYFVLLCEMRKIQESILQTNAEPSEAGIAELNSIYAEIMSICTISRIYFTDTPKKQRLFHLPEIILHIEGVRPESVRAV